MGEMTFQPEVTENTQTDTQLGLEYEVTNFLGKYF